DLECKLVTVSHGFDRHHHELPYDHLVIGLGSITNFFNLPVLEQRALTMKSLGDAIHLRNRLIAHLEEADTECSAAVRRPLLTFVVAGGGFAGVETIAKNLIASVRGGTLKPFSFSTIGQLAAIGRRTGVANILGINFSGFIAWWMWRTIYVSKLPRFEKKLRVALDWTLDLLFTKDLVQFQTFRAPTISHADEGESSFPLSTSRVIAARALESVP